MTEPGDNGPPDEKSPVEDADTGQGAIGDDSAGAEVSDPMARAATAATSAPPVRGCSAPILVIFLIIVAVLVVFVILSD